MTEEHTGFRSLLQPRLWLDPRAEGEFRAALESIGDETPRPRAATPDRDRDDDSLRRIGDLAAAHRRKALRPVLWTFIAAALLTFTLMLLTLLGVTVGALGLLGVTVSAVLTHHRLSAAEIITNATSAAVDDKDRKATVTRERHRLAHRFAQSEPTIDPLVLDLWAEGILGGARTRGTATHFTTDRSLDIACCVIAQRRDADRQEVLRHTPALTRFLGNATIAHRALLNSDCWRDDFGGIRSTDAENVYASIHDDVLSLAEHHDDDEAMTSPLWPSIVKRRDALARLSERAQQIDAEARQQEIADESLARHGDTDQMIAATDLWIDATHAEPGAFPAYRPGQHSHVTDPEPDEEPR